MTDVILHIYDVTNSGSDKTNNTIMQINKIFKDGIGVGGIFHSAVQVYGNEEWSFGHCKHGSGVFSCPSGKNPIYTYRECIVLGKTNLSIFKVNQMLRELSRKWCGSSYDLLSRNCNHFCDEFCEILGVLKLPRWVNCFANAADAAMEIAGTTALRLRQARAEIVSASKVAYQFLLGAANNGNATCLFWIPLAIQIEGHRNFKLLGLKISSLPVLNLQVVQILIIATGIPHPPQK